MTGRIVYFTDDYLLDQFRDHWIDIHCAGTYKDVEGALVNLQHLTRLWPEYDPPDA